jgi:carboxyl-terminal processing protease
MATGLILLAVASAGCQGTTEAPSPTEASSTVTPAEDRLRVLEQIDAILSGDYLFPERMVPAWENGLASLRGEVHAGLEDEPYTQALLQLLQSLPQGTVSYATRAERIQAAMRATDTYEGIGALVAYRGAPDPRLILLAVVEGSPAASAGLRAHDAIHSIDDVPVTLEEAAAAVERVRGPAGTYVDLEVESPDTGRRTVTVARQRVLAADRVSGRVMSTGAVHLLVPVRADATLIDAVDAAMQALREEPDSSGLVIDLRIAASDARWPLDEMLTLFTNGELGGYVERAGNGPLVIRGRNSSGTQTVPLVVLVGPDTSGAPEVFAAAIQATGRGAIVGQVTAGEVFGFGASILLDGSELVYVRSSFTTPQGRDLGSEGVLPNFVVPSDWDQVSDARDPVLGTALGLLSP